MKDHNFSSWPSHTREEITAVSSVLTSNKVNYWSGEQGKKFEIEFAKWIGSEYAVALSNGTIALELALKALGIGSSDEVIVTSRSYFASASAIISVGAVPVFADVDLDSQNISVDTIKHLITQNTKAILCVHLGGFPCEMDSLINVAKLNKLYVIEDCAQAHGAKYKGRQVGAFGDVGCWSFCQDKIMTTGGEGGMITTNSKQISSKVWSYKDHGKSMELSIKKDKETKHQFKWLHNSFGTNARMTEMQAAIGRIQLKNIDKWHARRLNNMNNILKAVAACSGLRVPKIPNHVEHAAYKCYVFVNIDELKKGWDRDRIIISINNLGVPCFSGSCPEIYLEESFENTNFRPKNRMPVAKKLGETSLMFLVHPTLTDEEINKTCLAIQRVMKEAGNNSL